MRTGLLIAATMLLVLDGMATGAEIDEITAKFKGADTNDDRILSLDEATGGLGMSGEQFKRVDGNRDGRITLREVLRAHRIRPTADQRTVANYEMRIKNLLKAPNINAEERIQLQRIYAGIVNGSLTGAEAKTLLAAEKHIARLERIARSDGKFTAAERAKLRDDLKHLSGAIYRQKHDDERGNPKPHATPGVTDRQRNQAGRIHQGVVSGELTKGEAHRLIRGQKHIREMKQDMRSDGKITGKERAILHRTQNRQSRRIYKQKHDEQTTRPRRNVPPRSRRRR
jgi:hypothetical protein